MALECLEAGCSGKIKGAVGSGRFWEGDPYVCPRCSARYVIGITDDYEDDRIAYLVPAEQWHTCARCGRNQKDCAHG
jgi:DNA-directed RNA polymerase subunit RPC12/RpoP